VVLDGDESGGAEGSGVGEEDCEGFPGGGGGSGGECRVLIEGGDGNQNEEKVHT
jgi:hypothetical protein